jgi:hypothetical protein
MRGKGVRVRGMGDEGWAPKGLKKNPRLKKAGMTNQIPSQNYSSHSRTYTKKKEIWFSHRSYFF